MLCDKSLDLRQGDIAVCYADGEFTMKRVNIDEKNKIIWLMPANQTGNFKPIKVTPENNFIAWGIINQSIPSDNTENQTVI